LYVFCSFALFLHPLFSRKFYEYLFFFFFGNEMLVEWTRCFCFCGLDWEGTMCLNSNEVFPFNLPPLSVWGIIVLRFICRTSRSITEFKYKKIPNAFIFSQKWNSIQFNIA
jgi:hypothetical protein